MRLLFVSGTPTGGSVASTRQLAQRLAERGHAVGLLVRRRARPRAGLVVSSPAGAAARIAALPGRAWHALGRTVTVAAQRTETSAGLAVWSSRAPERVLPHVSRGFRPDVLVVSSVHRRGWSKIHSFARPARLPVVLYVRETSVLEQLAITELRADTIVTNSHVLSDGVRALGLEAMTIPSMIETDESAMASSRQVVLFVNPISSRGLDVAVALARARPDVRFAFQVSWPLRRRDQRALRRLIDHESNIELRPYESQAARVYRDARVLLLPYQVDQRPRVVVEAQWNGIPVLASDLPAHREAVGPGGLFVPLDAAVADWAASLDALWAHGPIYERLCGAALAHARRGEQDPEQIVDRFEALVARLARPSSTTE